MDKEEYLNDPVFQRMQWLVRNAFEMGFIYGKTSDDDEHWKDYWMKSKQRKFLVDNGLMTGEEGYK